MKEMLINTGSFIFFRDTEMDTGFFGKDEGRKRIIPHDGSQEKQYTSRILGLKEKYQISATWTADAFGKLYDMFESIVEEVTAGRMNIISKVDMACMVAQSYGR